jgi:hypothetical protein
MNRQQLYRWMNDPATLDSESLGILQQLSEDFPYFPVVRLLHLLNLKVLNDYRFERELRHLAVSLPDRARLRDWLSAFDNPNQNARTAGIIEPLHLDPVEQQVNIHLRQLEKQIRESLLEIEQKQVHLKELLEEKRSITANTVQADPESQDDERILTLRPLPKDELIDEFIQRSKMRPENRPSFYNPDEYAQKSIEENEGILSETLARLIAAQGKKDRAIKIYQQLMLKNPQKSSYFAAQIEKLRKEL